MSRLTVCPGCGGNKLWISKAFVVVRTWLQDGELASYWDYEEPDNWENDSEKTEFICHNKECGHVWYEDISVDDLLE